MRPLTLIVPSSSPVARKCGVGHTTRLMGALQRSVYWVHRRTRRPIALTRAHPGVSPTRFPCQCQWCWPDG